MNILVTGAKGMVGTALVNNLDEDEMEKFLTDSFQGGCPYYRLEDEYRTVRKQM